MLKSLRSSWMLFIVVAVTLLVDQFTKYLAVTLLSPVKVWAPVPSLAHVFTFTYVTNTGAAFGLFKDLAPIFIVVAVVVITVIFLYQRQVPQGARLVRVALGLQLGGATGNLIDRLHMNGHVVDFLHLHYYTPTLSLDWPVSNVADIAIVTGVFLLAFTMLRESREPVESVPQQTESTDSNSSVSA